VSTEVNGKTIYVYNRIFCLVCSPFGSNTGSHLLKPPVDRETPRICGRCSKSYIYNRKKDKNQTVTRQNYVILVQHRLEYKKRRKYLLNIKVENVLAAGITNVIDAWIFII